MTTLAPARPRASRTVPIVRRRTSKAGIAAALANAPLFSALEPAWRADLAAGSRIVVLQARQRLWKIDDDAVHLGLVLAGRLKLVQPLGERDVIVDLALPGDVLGEVAFTLGARYQSDVVCLRRGRVLLVPAATVRSFLERDPRATAQLAIDLAAQVRRLMRLVEDLSAGSVERRLARVLVGLAERAGQPFPGGILVPLRLRRADLAALAATTVESISRRVSAWRARRWVEPQPAGYLIRDVEMLRRIASGA